MSIGFVYYLGTYIYTKLINLSFICPPDNENGIKKFTEGNDIFTGKFLKVSNIPLYYKPFFLYFTKIKCRERFSKMYLEFKSLFETIQTKKFLSAFALSIIITIIIS